MPAESYPDEVLILQVKNWQTADKYAVCFSRHHGKTVFLAYGARFAKSAAGRLVQPFAKLNASFYTGARVDKLKNCELAAQLPQFTLPQLGYASLMAEVTEQLTEQGEGQEAVFELLVQALALLQQRNPRIVALAFILKLLDLCGIGPVYEVCVHCSNPTDEDAYFSCEQGGLICQNCYGAFRSVLTQRIGSGDRKVAEGDGSDAVPGLPPLRAAVRELWQKLRLMDLERPEAFRIQGRDLMELEYIVHAYLLYQTDRPLRSLEFLRQVGDTARPAAAVDK